MAGWGKRMNQRKGKMGNEKKEGFWDWKREIVGKGFMRERGKNNGAWRERKLRDFWCFWVAQFALLQILML